jgi:hypothetical protein
MLHLQLLNRSGNGLSTLRPHRPICATHQALQVGAVFAKLRQEEHHIDVVRTIS